MKLKSDIFPPGAHPIFPPGRSLGDRGGTSSPAEGNFHGRPEPPPDPAVWETTSRPRRRARGDPPGNEDGLVRRRCSRTLPEDSTARRAHASRRPERKRTVDYEHRILGPPGGGWRERAQGPPSLWIGPSPPGHFRSRRGGPPGATQDTFHSLSAERRRDARLATLPETTRQGRRNDKHMNQGR
jgi:hypothetical protein